MVAARSLTPAAQRDVSALPSKGLAHSKYRFPRACRLTTASAFKHVFDNAFKSSDGYVSILAKANGSDCPRLGLAISKRNIRLASGRNRLKRVVRETFRLYQHELSGVDFVIMARAGALQADHETISRSLRKHWARLVKQCKPSWSPSSSSTDT